MMAVAVHNPDDPNNMYPSKKAKWAIFLLLPVILLMGVVGAVINHNHREKLAQEVPEIPAAEQPVSIAVGEEMAFSGGSLALVSWKQEGGKVILHFAGDAKIIETHGTMRDQTGVQVTLVYNDGEKREFYPQVDYAEQEITVTAKCRGKITDDDFELQLTEYQEGFFVREYRLALEHKT